MKERKLKIANIGDWKHRGGNFYVAGYSQKDMVDLLNQAVLKILNLKQYYGYTIGGFRIYGAMGCWGNSMEGIAIERGVWWEQADGYGLGNGEPERII